MTDPNPVYIEVEDLDLTKGPRGTPVGETYDPGAPSCSKLTAYRDLSQLDSEAALVVEAGGVKADWVPRGMTFSEAYAELRRIADDRYCTLQVEVIWSDVYKRTDFWWRAYIDSVGSACHQPTVEHALSEIRKLAGKAPPADLTTIDLEKIPTGECDGCGRKVPVDELQHRFSSSGETSQCEECLAP